jgi:hypothetical protein
MRLGQTLRQRASLLSGTTPHHVCCGFKTGIALAEHKNSASPPKPDICALMSTRPNQAETSHRRPLAFELPRWEMQLGPIAAGIFSKP